ncbi:hypothetical protein QZQ97_10475 [Serratia sp. root2]|nr:hypothetical protein [Serratia sp. root2]
MKLAGAVEVRTIEMAQGAKRSAVSLSGPSMTPRSMLTGRQNAGVNHQSPSLHEYLPGWEATPILAGSLVSFLDILH